MKSDSFYHGLMQAIGDYANACGVDSYALWSGGHRFDLSLPLGSPDRDYSHVRRKADFRHRIDNLLALFLEEQAALEMGGKESEYKSVPVMDDEEVAKRSVQSKEDALKWLAEFKWENLNSKEYRIARHAWVLLDHIKGMCAMHEDTQAALKAAAEKAGVEI